MAARPFGQNLKASDHIWRQPLDRLPVQLRGQDRGGHQSDGMGCFHGAMMLGKSGITPPCYFAAGASSLMSLPSPSARTSMGICHVATPSLHRPLAPSLQ